MNALLPTPITAIKVCGIKEADLAAQTVRLGARFIGIMMYQRSKRYVTADEAADIAKAAKDAGGLPVAVFVDTPAAEMAALCEKIDVDIVQLHGSISRREHKLLPDAMHRIYVLHVDDDGNLLADADEGLDHLDSGRDILLFDSVRGGSGKTYPLANFKNPYPLKFIIAGGLSIDNVANVIGQVNPDAVDVSSGIEDEQGEKQASLISSFIDAVNNGATK